MTEQTAAPLPRDYTLEEVAKALGMSTRWVRERIKDGAEHQRYGHKIAFTATQVESLRASHKKQPVEQSMTTRRRG